MNRAITFVITVCFVNCASSGIAQENSELAKLEPPTSIRLEYPAPVADEELSASQHLEQGFSFYAYNQCDQAAAHFKAAITTGNLNDAGRALAYWHIADCMRKNDNVDNACEAYSSFVIVAQDILDVRDYRQYAVAEGADFVQHFNLFMKMAEAKAYIHSVWAARNDHYGRSQDTPIIMHSVKEVEYFTEFACENGCDLERAVLAEDGVPVTPHTERVTLKQCDESVDVYFVVVVEKNDADE
jgi:hypothetical protein